MEIGAELAVSVSNMWLEGRLEQLLAGGLIRPSTSAAGIFENRLFSPRFQGEAYVIKADAERTMLRPGGSQRDLLDIGL